jgi:type IV secretion system protein VirB3
MTGPVLVTSHESDEPDDPLVARIRKTLLEQFLLFGVDRRWCASEVLIVVTVAAGLRNPWVLLAVLVTHPVLWMAVRSDPNQISCYTKYSRQGDFYEPRQMLHQKLNVRPKGFSRGTLC